MTEPRSARPTETELPDADVDRRDYGVTTWMLPERGEAGLRWAAEAGFVLVHLDPNDIREGGARSYAAEAESLGVALGGVSADSIPSIGFNDVRAAHAAITDTLSLAGELGVDFVYLPAFGPTEIVDEATLEAMTGLIGFALAHSAPSTVIGIECTISATELRRLFDAVDDPRFAQLFDVQNPAFWGHDAAAIARDLPGTIGPFVHVKDGVKGLGNARIGEGTYGVRETVAAVKAAGFVGTYVLESNYQNGDLELARTDQRLLDELLRS